MKTHAAFRKIVSIRLILLLLFFSPSAYAAGLLKPVSGDRKSVKMKSHHVNVVINNGFAKTEVDQVFFNSSGHDLEAIYSFPVPEDASLSELSLWIDGREVIGEVLEKTRAKKAYQQQKSEGNHTALAVKNSYKTFDVKVYPVKSHDETRVRLVYYQPARIDLSVGRYVYPLEDGGTDNNRNNFWSVDSEVTDSLVFNLELKSAFPVRGIRLPGYDDKARITKTGNEGKIETYNVALDLNPSESRTRAIKLRDETIEELDAEFEEEWSGPETPEEAYNVTLDLKKGGKLSKDIVCYYRLSDNTPARVELIPFKEPPGKDGTFMVVVTPGGTLRKIEAGADWTFVLDISGSMKGTKINALADGVSRLIGDMSGEDRFRIITFNDSTSDLTGGYIRATPENIREYLNRIKSIHASGGTNLFKGLYKAYRGLDPNRTTGIVLVTDGVATVGKTRQEEMMRLVKKNDYRLFTLVVGNSANRPLLGELAKGSGGFAMNISSSDDIVGRLIQAKAKVLHDCLRNVNLTIRGKEVFDITPATIPNLYMGQQLVMFGKYSEPGEVTIELTADLNNEEKSWISTAWLPDADQTNPELERLWALSKIKGLKNDIRMGINRESRIREIKEIGCNYSLVTDYTAMLVASETEMDRMEIDRKNAERVAREREAQAQKSSQPAQRYSVNRGSSSGSSVGGSSAHSIGSGPVGPLFLFAALRLLRRKRRLTS